MMAANRAHPPRWRMDMVSSLQFRCKAQQLTMTAAGATSRFDPRAAISTVFFPQRGLPAIAKLLLQNLMKSA